MANVNTAYTWVIAKCNSPVVGYSQAYRQGQWVNGIQYYDCSSLMSAAVYEAGFLTDNPWYTTFTEEYWMAKAGWEKMSPDQPWLPGDILLSNRREHTEMVYQGRRTMGAHSSSYPLPDQVSINDWDSSPDQWDYLFRYQGGGVTLEWITGDRYLDQSEMENNATIMFYYYVSLGLATETIAGIAGNMQGESTFCPDLNERGGGGGFGLVQWTPKSSLIDHANILGLSPPEDGDVQLQVIVGEVRNTPGMEEWYTTQAFITPYLASGASTDMIGITGEQFLSNEMKWSPSKLAIMFMAGYERPSYDPSTNHYLQRMQYADDWYTFFTGLPPEPPPQPGGKSKGMPLWMMTRLF